MDLSFWRGKRVFLTGHTGFKGTWLCRILVGAGAELTGYALTAPTEPNLFSLAGLEGRMTSIIADVRDADVLSRAFAAARPGIVFHMAAQPLVLDGYEKPAYTYATNVMGTVNLLECVRLAGNVRSLLNVTTDKVYHNQEWVWGYRESEPLDGFDPYSNSKSCSELVTQTYRRSFLAQSGTALSTARAGNVIGGGDFSANRIIPDCVRAAERGEPVALRHPHSIRPYQHVLEPLFAYLTIAMRQYEEPALAGAYNVGPEEADCIRTGELAALFCTAWGQGLQWVALSTEGPHEANFLKLDCSRLEAVFGWKPRWHVEEAVVKTVEWSKIWLAGGDVQMTMDEQIREYSESKSRECLKIC